MEPDEELLPLAQRLQKALAQELAIYDRLLRALQDQQEAIMARDAGAVVGYARTIDSHMVVIRLAKEDRACFEKQLATKAGLAEAEEYSELLPVMPEELRAAIGEIIDKITDRISHVQRYARQNNTLLAKMVELSQELIRRLGKQWEIDVEP